MQKAQDILEAGSTKSHAEPILTWTVHLLREQPSKLLLVIPAAALSLVASRVFFGTFTPGLIALFLIMGFISFYNNSELIHSSLGKSVLIGFSIFWLLRLIEQFVFFGYHGMALGAVFLVGFLLYFIPAVMILTR